LSEVEGTPIDALYTDLVAHIQGLSAKFVNHYIPAVAGIAPSVYEYEVRAYCVLSHAAFEDFVESVAMEVVKHSTTEWINTRRVDDVLLSMLSWNSERLKIDDDEMNGETRNFEYLRPLIDSAKKAYSRDVHLNHGVSILYLRNLLVPIAIDIKQDANLLNSLKKLSDGRGEYAHKGKVRSIMPPEDAKNYVNDCLVMCEDIKTKALEKLL